MGYELLFGCSLGTMMMTLFALYRRRKHGYSVVGRPDDFVLENDDDDLREEWLVEETRTAPEAALFGGDLQFDAIEGQEPSPLLLRENASDSGLRLGPGGGGAAAENLLLESIIDAPVEGRVKGTVANGAMNLNQSWGTTAGRLENEERYSF